MTGMTASHLLLLTCTAIGIIVLGIAAIIALAFAVAALVASVWRWWATWSGALPGVWLTDPDVAFVRGTNDIALLEPLGYRDRDGRESWLPPPHQWDGSSFRAWMLSFLGMKIDRRHRRSSGRHDKGCRDRTQPAWITHRDYHDGLLADGVNPRRAALEWMIVFAWRPWWRVQPVESGGNMGNTRVAPQTLASEATR